jgi:predicted patatin/cPLA2 family phospholipase
VLSPPVKVQGRECLDGGISDPIPIEYSVAGGHHRNVVVLTRNAGYRKDAQPVGLAARFALARYPEIRAALGRRHETYAACLKRVAELEATGEAFVLRPVKPLAVDRLERSADRLDALYRQGYEETMERTPALKAWLAAEDA